MVLFCVANRRDSVSLFIIIIIIIIIIILVFHWSLIDSKSPQVSELFWIF